MIFALAMWDGIIDNFWIFIENLRKFIDKFWKFINKFPKIIDKVLEFLDNFIDNFQKLSIIPSHMARAFEQSDF